MPQSPSSAWMTLRVECYGSTFLVNMPGFGWVLLQLKLLVLEQAVTGTALGYSRPTTAMQATVGYDKLHH